MNLHQKMRFQYIWKAVLLAFFICMSSVSYAADTDYVWVPYNDPTAGTGLLPRFEWSCGCSPTAGAMVLGYWDNYGPTGGGNWGKFTAYGRLIDYYIDEDTLESYQGSDSVNFYWQHSGSYPTRPMLIVDLAWAMDTTGNEGSTFRSNQAPGINSVVNSKGYGNGWANRDTWFCWTGLKGEIDDGRPVMVSIPNHSVCCFGYSETYDKFATHDPNYATRYDYDKAMLDDSIVKVDPENGTSSEDVDLRAPDGGENWEAESSQTISWYQYNGSRIDNVDIYYSTNGGTTFSTIATWVSTSYGWNYYTWNIPSGINSTRMRIKIRGWEGGSACLSEDGSQENFSVSPPSNLLPPTGMTASDGTYDYRVLISCNSVSGATHYKFYRATSSGGTKTALTGWQTSRSYNDTGATPGTTYYYWAKAAASSSGSRESAYSSYNTGWRAFAPTRIIRLSGDLAFGSVTVGQTSQRTLTIFNDGNSPLTVSGISYPTGFSGIWSGAISAGGSRNVTVTFAPTAATSYGGTVTVNSDKTSGTNTISCSGTGTAASTRIIRLSGNLAFGSVTVGQTSQRTLTIFNDGNSPLTVSGISYPTCFSGSWSGAISAGGSRNVTVTFAPTAATSYGGTVTVSSDKTSGTNTISCSGTGAIVHASDWLIIESGTTEDLYGVWGSPTNKIYVAGDDSVLHYNGSEWISMVGSTSSRSIWGSSDKNIYTCEMYSLDYICHFDGLDWSCQFMGALTAWFNAIWGSSQSDIYAVGRGPNDSQWGYVKHYNGSQWSTIDIGVNLILNGVWGSSNNNVYIVGNDGAIAHFNGISWSTMQSNTNVNLYNIWGNAEDVFAVGDNGTIMHYDGSTWSPMQSNTPENLFGIWGTGIKDVFAVGDNGTIMHYDGSTWSPIQSITSNNLYGICGRTNGDVFIVGANGTILQKKSSKAMPWLQLLLLDD